MATKKITLNELRSIVKQIIKENDNYAYMSDSDISAENDGEITDIISEQLNELYDFDNLNNLASDYINKITKELNQSAIKIKDKFKNIKPNQQGNLKSAIWKNINQLPLGDDYEKERYLNMLFKMAIGEGNKGQW
jgi:DNA-directed RNA polymerase subunit F